MFLFDCLSQITDALNVKFNYLYKVCFYIFTRCSPKGKSQEKYRVSKQFDGNSSHTDGSSKPLSPQFWPDVNEIKINITNDCDIDLGSKSEI